MKTIHLISILSLFFFLSLAEAKNIHHELHQEKWCVDKSVKVAVMLPDHTRYNQTKGI